MLKLKLGGLYWPQDTVRQILALKHEGGKPAAILDIGTGSGTFPDSNTPNVI